jgi:hypothetical protein
MSQETPGKWPEEATMIKQSDFAGEISDDLEQGIASKTHN